MYLRCFKAFSYVAFFLFLLSNFFAAFQQTIKPHVYLSYFYVRRVLIAFEGFTVDNIYKIRFKFRFYFFILFIYLFIYLLFFFSEYKDSALTFMLRKSGFKKSHLSPQRFCSFFILARTKCFRQWIIMIIM